MRKSPHLAATLCGIALIVACAPADAPAEHPPKDIGEESLCDASAATSLIGERQSEEIGARLRTLTGARQLRWVPHGAAVTMDYRADRLTISLDKNNAIERISCG